MAPLTKGFPPGVTLKAGPWASNEEAKIVLILDIQDHALDLRTIQRRRRHRYRIQTAA